MYPRPEDLRTLGEDASLHAYVERMRPTVFFRPGERVSQDDPRFLHCDADGLSRLAFISQYGSHEAQVNPIYGGYMPIRVVKRYVHIIAEVPVDLYLRTYPLASTQVGLIAYLGKKYHGLNPTPQTVVTACEVRYMNEHRPWMLVGVKEKVAA